MNAAQLAECATLGALLTRPDPLDSVTTWLRAEDFSEPWHRQLFTVLRERHVAGQPINAEDVGLDLLDRVGARRADLTRVVGVLQVTPPRPDPAVYARMVLESSLRREVAQQGVLLRASALSAALQHAARPLYVGSELVDLALREGERRWLLASGESSSPSTTHPELASALRNPDRFLAADRLLSAHPSVEESDAPAHERETVAALICHPEQLPEVRTWLRPELLTEPQSRAAYRALLDVVDEALTPVDAITVAWQCQRASNRSEQGPEPLDLVRAVDDALSADPAHRARRVAEIIVRRSADSSARLLETAADNPGLDVPDMYETARVATRALRSVAPALDALGSRVRHLSTVPEAPNTAHVPAVSPVAG